MNDEIPSGIEERLSRGENRGIAVAGRNGTGKGISFPKPLTLPEIFAFEDPQSLADGLLPKGAVVILSSYTGLGKTLVAHEIERSVMDGFPVFGHFRIAEPGPVLLFDEESPGPFLKDRLQRMGFAPDLPFYCFHFAGLRVDAPKHFGYMKETVKELKPALVVFDALCRFHGADENSATEMSAVMARFRQLANLGPTVLVIHHANKGDGDMRKRSRGSSDIIGAVDLELAMTQAGDELVIQSVKSRQRSVSAFKVKIEEQNERLAVRYIGEKTSAQNELKTALREILAAGPRSFNEIDAALATAGIAAPRTTLQRTLSDMRDETRVSIGERHKKLYALKEGVPL